MVSFFPPPPGVKNRRCGRCGLNTPQDNPDCRHCSTLDDRQLQNLQQAIDDQHRHHKLSGALFIVLALLIGAAMLL